jgi:hypothetical protein
MTILTPKVSTSLPGPPPSSANAITALVLGIIGVVSSLGTCCCCVSFVPALCAPAAWFIGWKELRDIRAGRAPYAGESNAQIGMILGIVGTALLALYIVLLIGYIVLVGFAAAMEGLKAGGVPALPR